MMRRLASLAGAGMMAVLVCLIPAAVRAALDMTCHQEPVRWVTLPFGLPSSMVTTVAIQLVIPLLAGAALGFALGASVALAGSALVSGRGHRQLDRAYWDAGLLVLLLCSVPLWPRVGALALRLAGGAGSPVEKHGSWWPWGLPLAGVLALGLAAWLVHLLSRSRSGDRPDIAVGRWTAGTALLGTALLGAEPLLASLERAGLIPSLRIAVSGLLLIPLLLALLSIRMPAGPVAAWVDGLGSLVTRARLPQRFRIAGLRLLVVAPLLLLLCLVLAGVAGVVRGRGVPSTAAGSAERPNLVLIYIDTLRRDHLSCYGRDRRTTPSLDRLASRSVTFPNATSPASHTVPAVCSVMTCRYPASASLSRGVPFQLSGESRTLAELLRGSGYRTAAFIGNYVLGRDYDTRIWHGFEVFDDRFPQRESERRIPEREAAVLGRAAVSWLKAHQDQQFFLWLHFQDPHGPYTPPSDSPVPSSLDDYGAPRTAPLAGDNFSRGGIPVYQRLDGGEDPRLYLAGYDGEIAHTDRQIGLVLAWLRKLGLEENTMVALLSDHGEAMEDDHGWYFSHGHDLTEDQVRVPLLLRVPGVDEGRVAAGEVSTLDLFPTLLGLAGVEVPRGLPGRDLLRFDEGGEEPLVLTFTGGVRAVRWGPYKLILRGNRTFLYNTELDPGETSDLSGEEKGLAHWLTREMNETLAGREGPGDGEPAAGWNEDVRERLRMLGYVD